MERLEERIIALEAELAKLRDKPPTYSRSAYAEASQKCKEYFESVKGSEQHYGACNTCEQAARAAMKERRGAEHKGENFPSRYIRTEEDGAEYLELFKEFLAVYQDYLNQKGVVYERAD